MNQPQFFGFPPVLSRAEHLANVLETLRRAEMAQKQGMVATLFIEDIEIRQADGFSKLDISTRFRAMVEQWPLAAIGCAVHRVMSPGKELPNNLRRHEIK